MLKITAVKNIYFGASIMVLTTVLNMHGLSEI